jgi:hypothetical protein
MEIRYFFIKDKVDTKEIRIEYCPTNDMIADFFTKPIQGVLFKRLRDHIMNIDPHDKYHSNHRSVLDELDDSETVTVLNSAGSDSDGHKSLASAPKKVIEKTKDRFCKGELIIDDEGHSTSFDKD